MLGNPPSAKEMEIKRKEAAKLVEAALKNQ
jgi:hypothetical protein